MLEYLKLNFVGKTKRLNEVLNDEQFVKYVRKTTRTYEGEAVETFYSLNLSIVSLEAINWTLLAIREDRM